MKRIKPAGLITLAIFATTALTTSIATAALPNILNLTRNNELPIIIKGKAGAGHLVQAGEPTIGCASSVSLQTFQTEKLGTFDITFSGCLIQIEGFLALCFSLGTAESATKITALGTFHLRYHGAATSEKKVAVELLLQPVHFECRISIISKLLLVTGCIAGLLTPVNTRIRTTGTMGLSFRQSGGKQEVTEVLNEAATAKEHCILLAGGREAAEESSTTLEKAEGPGGAIEVEVMA